MAEDAASVGTGAVTGAAKGAAIGSVAGPVGTIVGGIVGGVLGAISGIFSSQSKRYLRKAYAEEQAMQDRQAALQRRNLVRDMYVARAQSVAASAAEDGALMSSAPLGAIGSIVAQGNFNQDYFDSQVINQKQKNYWLKKAHKKTEGIATIGSIFDAASSLADSGAFSSFGSSPAPTAAKVEAPSTFGTTPKGPGGVYTYGGVMSGP